MIDVGRLTRISLFAALCYVLSWATAMLPNINPIFFVVFTAGFLWGATAGMLVGAVGMGLWTTFNPYGPAMLPIALAQILGTAASGVVGSIFGSMDWASVSPFMSTARLVLASAICTILFFLPVTLVDAWLLQPFWPRFVTGSLWAGISLLTNAVIFPLLFVAVQRLYRTEKNHL